MLGFHQKWLFAGLIVLAMLLISPIASSADSGKVGTIKGHVNYCGKGGYLGMQVFIPGRQFSVFLGKDGNFIFNEVPAGNYDINYVINGRLVNENKNISVSAGGTNDLGVIAFCDDAISPPAQTPAAEAKQPQTNCETNPQSPDCIDADQDGVVAAKDCNDNDANIRPGAIELCDAIDNNCNGEVDEALIVDIKNGRGFCNKGKVSVKSCREGFSDCDKDPANGCEIDIYNDNNNCGSCGNQCLDIEICRLGIC